MAASLPPDFIKALLDGPAAMPPPGVVPNFNHTITSHPGDIALLAIALGIMTLAVGIRIFARWSLAKSYVLEDFMVLLAWALEVTYVALSFICAKYGAGSHMWDNKLGSVLQMAKWITIASILYYPAITLIKVAILRQFLRVFAPNTSVNAPMFWACWLVIILTAMCYTVLLGLNLGQCQPWERIWNPFVAGHCITSNAKLAIIVGWINVASDALILVLPLPCMYRLNMKWRAKLAISCLFLAGILACVASALRLYYTYTTIRNFDVSYHSAVIGIITVYEVCLGALVLCLPTFPKVFTLVKDKVRTFLSTGARSRSNEPLSNPSDRGVIKENKAFGSPHAAAAARSLGISSVTQYLGRGHSDDDILLSDSRDDIAVRKTPATSEDGISASDRSYKDFRNGSAHV